VNKGHTTPILDMQEKGEKKPEAKLKKKKKLRKRPTPKWRVNWELENSHILSTHKFLLR
jgi:hypothetical protein